MSRTFYVYILASQRNGTLYIGVTNDIARRVWEHREGRGSKFTRRYKVKFLVHVETFDSISLAIQRETNLKRWPRRWKLALIEQHNPTWLDLTETII
jgi:putative endonuclease